MGFKVTRKEKEEKIQESEEKKLPYDKVVIATGSSNSKPPITNIDAKGVFGVKTPVDGVEIQISQGDNIYAVGSKINDSAAAVKASVDPIRNALNLETTDARQLWLQDVSGNTLEELGIIKDSSQLPPYNIATGTRVSGGSMFDAVIAFRNALLSGDQEAIGSRVLGSLDQGIDSLVTRIAKSGAEYERAQLNATRNGKLALDVTQMVSREGDLDFTKAITDLKMLDYTNQATLSQAGKMYSSTLLNYMR